MCASGRDSSGFSHFFSPCACDWGWFNHYGGQSFPSVPVQPNPVLLYHPKKPITYVPKPTRFTHSHNDFAYLPLIFDNVDEPRGAIKKTFAIFTLLFRHCFFLHSTFWQRHKGNMGKGPRVVKVD